MPPPKDRREGSAADLDHHEKHGVTRLVFRSADEAVCRERAFLLLALSIPSELEFEGGAWCLLVDDEHATRALAELQQYERERRTPTPARLPAARLHRRAWIGTAAYVLVEIGVTLAISKGWVRSDAYRLGAMDAAAVQAGQVWRAWTALTLHVSGPHLMSNLGGGAWFGYLAARQFGNGIAWLLVVTGAAAANLCVATFGPASYRSVGASTAIFTALGLMAAHTWRTRRQSGQSWARRWAPLIAGTVLLGLLGSSQDDPGTDLVAHAGGFTIGVLQGMCVASARVASALDRVPQWLAGAAALASIGTAWGWALSV